MSTRTAIPTPLRACLDAGHLPAALLVPPAPGGWVIPPGGKKFHIQQSNTPHPDRVADRVKAITALRPRVPMIVAVSSGRGAE